jgi:hypothetical protein
VLITGKVWVTKYRKVFMCTWQPYKVCQPVSRWVTVDC